MDLYLISKELAAFGYQCSFIVGDFGQPKKEYIQGVHLMKSYRIEESKLIQILKLISRLFSSKADIFVQEGASGGTGIISLFAKVFGKKFIYRTASDIDCNGSFIRENGFEGQLYKLGLKLASAVITQNEQNRTQLLEGLGIKSIVIRNGATIPDGNDTKREYVLWVGRSEELKQPELFIDLAKKLPAHEFMMISPVARLNSVDVPALIAKMGSPKNLSYKQSVPFDEIDQVFARAIIFVNTSRYEGFPNTFVQAAKNSVPIYSLNVNPDGFIDKFDCGHFSSGSFEDLLLGIKNVLENTQLQQHQRMNAHDYAVKHHSISEIIKEYIRVIEIL
jgi:glycosyltransferase involved in cell wall biosynthesis